MQPVRATPRTQEDTASFRPSPTATPPSTTPSASTAPVTEPSFLEQASEIVQDIYKRKVQEGIHILDSDLKHFTTDSLRNPISKDPRAFAHFFLFVDKELPTKFALVRDALPKAQFSTEENDHCNEEIGILQKKYDLANHTLTYIVNEKQGIHSEDPTPLASDLAEKADRLNDKVANLKRLETARNRWVQLSRQTNQDPKMAETIATGLEKAAQDYAQAVAKMQESAPRFQAKVHTHLESCNIVLQQNPNNATREAIAYAREKIEMAQKGAPAPSRYSGARDVIEERSHAGSTDPVLTLTEGMQNLVVNRQTQQPTIVPALSTGQALGSAPAQVRGPVEDNRRVAIQAFAQFEVAVRERNDDLIQTSFNTLKNEVLRDGDRLDRQYSTLADSLGAAITEACIAGVSGELPDALTLFRAKEVSLGLKQMAVREVKDQLSNHVSWKPFFQQGA